MRTDDDRSAAAELATIRSQLDELTHRVTAVADRYRPTPDATVTGDLDTAERGLIAARRAVERARNTLGS